MDSPNNQKYTDNGYDISRLEIVSNQGGDPIDLRSQFMEITIYESIFTDKLVGEVVLIDGLNYAESIPIVGNETIIISYKTQASDAPYVEIRGKVVAPLGKSRADNGKIEMCKLQFVSDLQYRNTTKRISSVYEGSISRIVRKIFSDGFGDRNIESLKTVHETDGRHRFIIPFWSPLFAVNWLSERAYKRDTSCFVFYEDVDGFHFRNLMVDSRNVPVMNYKVEPKNPDNMSDINSFMELVQDYSVTSFFDRLDEFANGMYAGTLHTHDLTTKKFDTYDMEYFDLFDSSNHMNKHPLLPRKHSDFTKGFDAFRNMSPIQTRKFDSIRDNEVPDKYLLNRKSIQKQFTTFRLTIVVPGNSSLRLLDCIDFTIPKIGYLDATEQDWKDDYLSGNYMIVSIRTTIHKKDGYKTTIEMSKDSLIKGIPDQFAKIGSNIK